MNVLSRILASRKFWLALATIVGVIIVQVGADPANADRLTSAIVTIGGVIIAAIALEDTGEKIGGGIPGSASFENTPGQSAGGQDTPRMPVWAGLLLAGLCLGAVGCAPDQVSVQADAARFAAVQPVVTEFKMNHPEQAISWDDFMRSWQRSIDARKGRAPATQPTTY